MPKVRPTRGYSVPLKPPRTGAGAWGVKRWESHSYQIVYSAKKSGDVFHVLLLSDIHWDSKDCERDQLKADLEKAKKIGAAVLICGDLYDVMEGKYDPRATKDQLRPEFLTGNYFDEITDQSIEWFKPYAANIALVAPGNHETSVMKRQEIDLIDRFCEGLRRAGGNPIRGNYWGFVALSTDLYTRRRQTILHYHHGYGGGGEVTRGLIDNNRTRGQYEADIYFSGHIHRQNVEENVITRLSTGYKPETVRQLFLRGAGYKEEHLPGHARSKERDTWHAEKGRAARPIGGWWVRVRVEATTGGHVHGITYERT